MTQRASDPTGGIGCLVILGVLVFAVWKCGEFHDKFDQYAIDHTQTEAEVIANAQGIIDNASSKVDLQRWGTGHNPRVIDVDVLGQREFSFVIRVHGTGEASKAQIDQEAREYAERIAFVVPRGAMVRVKLLDEGRTILSKARCEAGNRLTLTAVNED